MRTTPNSAFVISGLKLVKKLKRRVRNRESAQRRRSEAAIARSWNHVKPE